MKNKTMDDISMMNHIDRTLVNNELAYKVEHLKMDKKEQTFFQKIAMKNL